MEMSATPVGDTSPPAVSLPPAPPTMDPALVALVSPGSVMGLAPACRAISFKTGESVVATGAGVKKRKLHNKKHRIQRKEEGHVV